MGITTKMNLQPNAIQRLAFIKYLYHLGIQQSEMPEPLSAVSLLNFHDAIELFLQLASEQLDVGKVDIHFMEYWQLLSQKLDGDKELSQKESVRRLNDARVSLKHHGTLPSKLDVESFRATATSFFEENTPVIFNAAFDTISMTDFVQPEQARENLKAAETLLGDGKLDEALGKSAIAFQQMLDDYESRKRDDSYRSLFFFGEDLTFYRSHYLGLDGSQHRGEDRTSYTDKNWQELEYERKLGEFVDRVGESLMAIQEAIKILAMGIDYRRYSRFRFLAPFVDRNMRGDYIVNPKHKMKVAAEDVRFCIEFIVETAVKLQEFDYSLSASDL